MSSSAYTPLSRPQLEQLLAPENKALELAWSRLRGALHGVVSMFSITHPRPLYHYEASARGSMVEEPERLRGTAFYEPAMRNVKAAEEIERMFKESGHTPELHAVVDGYLDSLLDEFDAVRLYPEIPPSRDAEEELPGPHRAVAGR